MENEMYTHMFDCKNSIDTYKCGKCPNFLTNFLELLKLHISSDHLVFDSEWYESGKCFSKLQENSCLNLHVLCHNKSGKCRTRQEMSEAYKCEKAHLQLCRSSAEEIWKFNCDQCPAQYNEKRHLESHIRCCHFRSTDIKWLQCEQCPARYKEKRHLDSHTRCCHSRPKDIKWLQCEQCPSKFKKKSDMDRHVTSCLAKRAEIQWISCQQCPRKFKNGGYLKIHTISSHSKPEDVKWFQCEECPSRFRRQYNLHRHTVSYHHKAYAESEQETDRKQHEISCHGEAEDSRWLNCKQYSSKKFKQKTVETPKI